MSKARDIADLDFNSPDIDGGTIDGATLGANTVSGTVTFNSAPTFNTAISMNSSLNVASTIGIAGTTVISSSRDLQNVNSLVVDRATGNATIDATAHSNNTRSTVSTTAKNSGGTTVRGVIGSYGDANKVDIGTLSTHTLSILTDNTVAANFDTSQNVTFMGDIIVDSSNAEINLKSGVGGTTGAINWTFNTDDSNFAALKLPYDSRASVGLHIDSGYPITLDYSVSGADGLRMSASGVMHNRFNSSGAHFNTPQSSNLDFKVSSAGDLDKFVIDAGANEIKMGLGNDANSGLQFIGGGSERLNINYNGAQKVAIRAQSAPGGNDLDTLSIQTHSQGYFHDRLMFSRNGVITENPGSVNSLGYNQRQIKKYYTASSAFSNPTVSIMSLSAPTHSYPQIVLKITVMQLGLSANAAGYSHGYASLSYDPNGTNTWTTDTQAFVNEYNNYGSAVPTWSLTTDNTARTATVSIVCNRMTNYDQYSIEVEVMNRGLTYTWS